MARTSSLNCLFCRNPDQTPDSLNCLPPIHWKPLFSLKSASLKSLPNPSPTPLQMAFFDLVPKKHQTCRCNGHEVPEAAKAATAKMISSQNTCLGAVRFSTIGYRPEIQTEFCCFSTGKWPEFEKRRLYESPPDRYVTNQFFLLLILLIPDLLFLAF